MPLDIADEIQHLIATGLREALADGTDPGDILVLAAEGLAAEQLVDGLPDTIVGTTDEGTVVAVLVGDHRRAVVGHLDLGQAVAQLGEDQIPILMIDERNMLTMSAVRVVGGGLERRWSN